jgi:hypothetical protein
VTDLVMKGRDSVSLRIPLLRAIVEDNWKYIEGLFDRGIEPEFYNLLDDPLEQNNLYPASKSSGLIQKLAAHLIAMEAAPTQEAPSLSIKHDFLVSA